jgi:hypothetical protein
VRIAEYFTRFILHKKLGWKDLEFRFLNLDDPDLLTKIDILQKQYSCNALTPNEFRAELGKPPLQTPYANLTQFEAILVNTQAAGQIADANAAKASDRAADAQQKQMEQYQQMQQSQPSGTPPGEQQASLEPPVGPKPAKGPAKLKLKPPTKLRLPLLPMAGSLYSAYQIANMSVGELKAAIAKGNVPAKADTLVNNMQTQDPSILQQLAPEVLEYLDALKKQQQIAEDKSRPNISPQAIKDQKKKFTQSKHIPADIERTVYRTALTPTKKDSATRSIAPAFADKRPNGAGTGKEIAQTDVNKSRVKRRNGGS